MFACFGAQILIDLDRILRSAEGKATDCRIEVIEARQLNEERGPGQLCVGGNSQRRRILQSRVVRQRSVESAEAQLGSLAEGWVEDVACAEKVCRGEGRRANVVLIVWRCEC